MCMKKEDRHRSAKILRHVELALTVDMVTTWYAVGCWKSHKNCLFLKTNSCMYHGSLARNWTIVCVQSISQRSLSSCEYVIVYIFVCIVCCQFGGVFFLLYAWLNTVLLRAYQPTIAWYYRFGPKHPCVLVVTTSVYQTGAPTPRLKEDRNEISNHLWMIF